MPVESIRMHNILHLFTFHFASSHLISTIFPISVRKKILHIRLVFRGITHLTSFSTACLERLFAMKQGGVCVFGEADIAPVFSALISSLITSLADPRNAENEYIMKCACRGVSLCI